VNYVVCDDEVVPAAVKMAIELTHNSPDAVQSSRRALWDVSDSAGAEDAFRKHLWSSASERAYNGGNMQVSLDHTDTSPAVTSHSFILRKVSLRSSR
jgi:hypothetical protein